MATLDARYRINGVIDTARPVFENLETITNSCATWLSYDGIAGKWSVVINQPRDPVATLDDSSIIGGITLSTSNLADVYNECEVRFHNQELRDQEDYVLLATPNDQRLPNEPRNRMIINAPMVNNQIQAQLIGLIELKQSRLSDTIEFETDYSLINLEAGDVIEITNSVYGWTAREFRVLRITESEADGSIRIRITAQAYSDSIYDTSDLFEYVRDTETGLIELDPLKDVSAITANTAVLDAAGDPMLGLLGANALIALLKGLMEDDDAGSGSLFDQIFNVFDQVTGIDLLNTNYPVLIAADIGRVTVGNIPNPTSSTVASSTFVAPATGTYKIDVIADQNSSSAFGGRGNLSPNFYGEPLDEVSADFTLKDSGNVEIAYEVSGGEGAFYWDDFALTGLVTLTAGESYTLDLGVIYATESASGNLNITFGWQIISVGS